MDIAALIFAPLLLALIYNWSGINRLPRIARVGLPVGLLAVLFIAFIGYAPAIQEAVATRTPLIRQIEGLPLTFHVDGVALLFGLIITGVGAMMTSAASGFYEDVDAYRRFVRLTMILCSVMLGLVLADSINQLASLLIFPFLALLFLLNTFRVAEAVIPSKEDGSHLWPRWKQNLLILALYVAFLLPYGLLRSGISFLTELGGAATPTVGGSSGLALFSGYNLSHKISYEAFFLLLLAPLVFYILGIVWQWRSARNLPAVAHAFLPAGTMVSLLYLLTRFYPAVHDNPLWWTVIPVVGLLVMLIGAVWGLRQRDAQAILISSTVSLLGACVALLGLPEFLGYKVALIGIVGQALSGAALFLSPDVNRKRVRWVIQGLALLPLVIFYGLMIAAFAQVTLDWAGLALAVVMVSTVLWVFGMMRVFFADLPETALTPGRPTGHVDIALRSPLQFMSEIASGILAVVSLAFVGLFEPVVVPLLNPIVTKQPLVEDLSMPLVLGVLTIIGAVILYATREAWGRFVQITPAAENRQSA